jgi:hypothetical protein
MVITENERKSFSHLKPRTNTPFIGHQRSKTFGKDDETLFDCATSVVSITSRDIKRGATPRINEQRVR